MSEEDTRKKTIDQRRRSPFESEEQFAKRMAELDEYDRRWKEAFDSIPLYKEGLI